MSARTRYVNKPPFAPARYCRQCGKRIAVYRVKKRVREVDGRNAVDESGNWLYRYTGDFRYTRSEFFHSAICAEDFAWALVKMIDAGTARPFSDDGVEQVWTAITRGEGKQKSKAAA